MDFSTILLTLSLTSGVFAHGYVKWLGVDNKLYPGFNPHVDTTLGLKRIAFGQSYGNHPRYAPDNVLKPDIACGSNVVPAQLRATARAGSELVFGHSTWPITHDGPVITYLGPYTGNLTSVNVTDIEFFKIAELGLSPDGKTWATQVLTANDNVTSATIPHDIAPGNYIVRHEIITLHFATENSRYLDAAAKAKGAQHFISCFDIEVTGKGNAKPAGAKFPGAYKPGEPGIYYDLYRGDTTYQIPGPPLYKPSTPAPILEPKPYEVVMPTGNIVQDIKYFNNMYVQAWKWDGQTFKRNYDSVHGLPDGPNPNMTRPGGCTVAKPCPEDMNGSNPSWGKV